MAPPPATRRARPLAAALAAALLAAACSTAVDLSAAPPYGGPEGDAFRAGLADVAEEVYEAEGLDRDEDFTRGAVPFDGCPVVDEAALEALAAAAGADALEPATAGFLNGPPEDEQLLCQLSDPEGDVRLSLVASATRSTPEQAEAQQLRGVDGTRTVDVEVEGVAADRIVATEAEGFLQVTWVGDDVLVGVGGPELDEDVAGPLLRTAIDEVARVLGADGDDDQS